MPWGRGDLKLLKGWILSLVGTPPTMKLCPSQNLQE